MKKEFWMEKEYWYDENGVEHKLSSSMMCVPGGARIISCPICRACLNQKYDEKKEDLYCEVYGEIPEKVGEGDIFQCKYYLADENSHFYSLIKKLMEEHKE